MGRTVLAIICALIGLGGFGVALTSTGARLISDCSQSVFVSSYYVWGGALVFLLACGAAISLRPTTGYLIIVGILPLLVLHDFSPGAAIRDILNNQCPLLRIP
ncbi:hypothetical protein [Qipengyuania qiaonensis]|uniref:Uncharacterized protein n=1 Tax=Qipengyuania qiaonensis TaxID=2867240 RepID=A0ABS7J4W0_9SPHN|nr:hypothetical protein [Qipengyuania qiaonensis]MBX7482377.1 hypothetical protein [Qipengyuania qiaonensis]